MYRRFLPLFLVALAATATAQVSPTVKGSREDMRGAKRVFVDTAYDRVLRDAIVATLAKELPDLQILDEQEGADLILRFSRSVADEKRDAWEDPPFSADESISRTPTPTRRVLRPDERPPGSPPDPDSLDPLDPPTRYALGSVLKPVKDGPMREALSFQQPIRTKAESAAGDFARKFAKEYRKVNGK